jgi:protein-disulfide isomerase
MLNKYYLYGLSGVLLFSLFFGGSILFKKMQKEELSFLTQENAEVLIRDHSPRFGHREAKVHLIEFLDPECESCRAFYPKIKNLLKEFDGKVQLIVRYAPFHQNSKIAIAALEAAKKQDKYWEAMELLFYYQPFWGDHHKPRPELIFVYLEKLGLDIDKLKADMKDPKIQQIIEQDRKDLKTLKVRATPTFFVNGKPLEKFGIDYLKKLVQEEVNLVYN